MDQREVLVEVAVAVEIAVAAGGSIRLIRVASMKV